MNQKHFIGLLLCTVVSAVGATLALATKHSGFGIFLVASALLVGRVIIEKSEFKRNGDTTMRTILVLLLSFALGALSVQARDKRFGPEVTALELLSEQGYTWPTLVIAPIETVSSSEALRLLANEGVDARSIFNAKKSDLPRAFTFKRADGTFEPTIFVMKESQTYQLAAKGQGLAVLLLASAILHENEHLAGASEQEARQVEVDFLTKQLPLVNDVVRPFVAENIATLRRLTRETTEVFFSSR